MRASRQALSQLTMLEPRFFENARDFHRWLQAHASSERELWVRFRNPIDPLHAAETHVDLECGQIAKVTKLRASGRMRISEGRQVLTTTG